MKNQTYYSTTLILFTSFIMSCSQVEENQMAQPSFSQGVGTKFNSDMTKCMKVDSGGVPARITNDGKITSTDGKEWVVPSEAKLNTTAKASDLFNVCNNVTPKNISELNIKNYPIHNIGEGEGEIFTAYIFADNYFEFSINGKLIAIDPLPLTPFNSSVIRFKAKRPFNLAIKAVDWEEYFGLGFETFGKVKYHAGDAGFVMVIKNSEDKIITVTDSSWKAQTFYIAPLKYKSCLSISHNKIDSSKCPIEDLEDGSKYFAAHWPLPKSWHKANFDDSSWPFATIYSTEEIGVKNKPAYTNFTEIFDDPIKDASFIWSKNIVLDNIVLLRKTIK